MQKRTNLFWHGHVLIPGYQFLQCCCNTYIKLYSMVLNIVIGDSFVLRKGDFQREILWYMVCILIWAKRNPDIILWHIVQPFLLQVCNYGIHPNIHTSHARLHTHSKTHKTAGEGSCRGQYSSSEDQTTRKCVHVYNGRLSSMLPNKTSEQIKSWTRVSWTADLLAWSLNLLSWQNKSHIFNYFFYYHIHHIHRCLLLEQEIKAEIIHHSWKPWWDFLC